MLFPAAALASSVPAFTFTTTTDLDGGDRRTQGWMFGVSSSILVTDLGVFDDGSDGLGEAHDVGLWACSSAACTSGSLLVNATVAAGTSPSLVNSFRYVSLLSPVTLTPGDYVIGAAYYENQPNGFQLDKVVTFLDTTTGFALAPQITFEGDRVANCGSVPCPTAAVFPDTTPCDKLLSPVVLRTQFPIHGCTRYQPAGIRSGTLDGRPVGIWYREFDRCPAP